MNLRVIKKEIEYCIGAFIDDCTIFAALNPGCDTDGVNAIADEAVELYNALRDKVNNVPEELRHKTSPKHQHRDKAEIAAEKAELRKKLNAYYDGIRKELIEKLDELNGKLSVAVANKAPKKTAEKVEKTPAKKAAPKATAKAAAEKPAVEEATAEKPATKKAPAKKATGEKAAKAPAKKATTKATAEKAPAKKAAPKATKATAEKAPAKKTSTKKPAVKKAEE